MIIFGTCGYFGYRYWSQHPQQVDAWIAPVIAAVSTQPASPPPEQKRGSLPPDSGPPRRLAPPGIFYMVERVSVTIPTGVIAVEPGEEVRLMQRKKGGRLRITTGRYDLDVKEAQVTNDFDFAQAARQKAGLPPTLAR